MEDEGRVGGDSGVNHLGVGDHEVGPVDLLHHSYIELSAGAEAQRDFVSHLPLNRECRVELHEPDVLGGATTVGHTAEDEAVVGRLLNIVEDAIERVPGAAVGLL